MRMRKHIADDDNEKTYSSQNLIYKVGSLTALRRIMRYLSYIKIF